MSRMKTGGGFKCPECEGINYGENDDGSVWCWQRGCGWQGSKQAAGMIQFVSLTVDQFRTLAKAIWDEAFTEGHDQGQRSTWPGSSISNEIRSGDELWQQSISNDAVEKLILVDNPKS